MKKQKRGVMTMKLVRLATIPATIVSLLAFAQPSSANAVTANSGFYDHQIIQYQATAEVTSSPHAARLISKGNIVFHIVDASGNIPPCSLRAFTPPCPTTPQPATCSTSFRPRSAIQAVPGTCRSSTGTPE